jgi:hypothetical protein
MVPKTIDNLILPVPVSGSHIGFSTLRMEPCWMALGQAAGIAASLAIDHDQKIKNIAIPELQKILIEQKATLIYFQDVQPDHTDFPMIQRMALRGYLPGWQAKLNDPVDKETLAAWERLSGIKLNAQAGSASRKDVLAMLYQQLK